MKILNTIFISLLAGTVSAQVGIGTTSPSNPLDIEADNAAIDINNDNAGDGDPVLNFQIDGVAEFSIGVDDSDADKLKIATDATFGTTALTIDASQNVGIGNTSPTATLDVDGSAIFNEGSNSVDFRVESNSNTHMLYIDGTNDEIGVNTSTPASGLDVQTSMGLANTTVTTATTLDATHNVVLASDAAGDFTITLPAATSNDGKVYYIKKTNSSENEITIDGNGAETIDGATTVVLYVQYDAIRILCDGTNWHIIADERKAHTCRLNRNTAQSISDETWTEVALNNEVLDVGGIGDPTTNNRIDIKRAGNYLISASVSFVTTSIHYVRLIIRVNDAGVTRATTWKSDAGGLATDASITTEINLSAGDYVEFAVIHSEGSAVDTETTAIDIPFLCVTEIR